VAQGLLEERAAELNRGFLAWARTGRPFVTLKLALSLDGRIALRGGDSQWITGAGARRKAHELRSLHDAVVVGVGTVLADDPQLTVRSGRGPNPARMVLDSRLSGPLEARWMADDGTRRIVATTQAAPARRCRSFAEAGAEIWLLPRARQGGVDLAAFLDRAVAAGFLSLMVEGGGRLASSFLKSELVNRFEFFFAPVLLGDEAPGFTGSLRISRMALAKRYCQVRLRRVGEDWRVTVEVQNRHVYRNCG